MAADISDHVQLICLEAETATEICPHGSSFARSLLRRVNGVKGCSGAQRIGASSIQWYDVFRSQNSQDVLLRWSDRARGAFRGRCRC